METEKDVHTEHCCIHHGCKYGDHDNKCTVVHYKKKQSHACEECDSVAEEGAEWVYPQWEDEVNFLLELLGTISYAAPGGWEPYRKVKERLETLYRQGSPRLEHGYYYLSFEFPLKDKLMEIVDALR